MSSISPTCRDRKIVAFLALNSCATLDILRLTFFGQTRDTANAPVKVMSRLRRHKYVERHWLYGKRCYYKTGYRAIELGFPWVKEPFGPIALPRLYAAMRYLNIGTVSRQRLSRHDLEATLPWLPYYGEVTYFRENEVLGAILTDLGGTEFYLVGKFRRFYNRRFELPEFRRLLDANLFRLVVISCHERRSQAIKRCLERDPLPFPVVLHAMPELVHFTMRTEDAAP